MAREKNSIRQTGARAAFAILAALAGGATVWKTTPQEHEPVRPILPAPADSSPAGQAAQRNAPTTVASRAAKDGQQRSKAQDDEIPQAITDEIASNYQVLKSPAATAYNKYSASVLIFDALKDSDGKPVSWKDSLSPDVLPKELRDDDNLKAAIRHYGNGYLNEMRATLQQPVPEGFSIQDQIDRLTDIAGVISTINTYTGQDINLSYSYLNTTQDLMADWITNLCKKAPAHPDGAWPTCKAYLKPGNGPG